MGGVHLSSTSEKRLLWHRAYGNVEKLLAPLHRPSRRRKRHGELLQRIDMSLLNYTTKIDADRTAQEIARCLSMHGASAVMTEYDKQDGYVSSLSFKIT